MVEGGKRLTARLQVGQTFTFVLETKSPGGKVMAI